MCENLLRKQPFSQKGADVWAFGVLVYFSLKKKFPFSGKNETEMLKNIRGMNVDWTGVHNVWASLLRTIWVQDSERITMQEVFFGFLKKLDHS